MQPPGIGRKPFDGGFTLIEVLVALAIITIALTSVYRLQSSTYRMSDDARFYTLAPLLAEAKLAEIDREGLDNALDDSGEFGSTHPGYAWTVRMENVPTELLKGDQHHLTRIDVTITKNEELRFDLRTYRFHAD